MHIFCIVLFLILSGIYIIYNIIEMTHNFGLTGWGKNKNEKFFSHRWFKIMYNPVNIIYEIRLYVCASKKVLIVILLEKSFNFDNLTRTYVIHVL